MAAPPRPAALAALRGEVGSEQEMSFNRLVFALVVLVYLLTAGRSVAAQSLPALALWGALAIGVFLHIRFRPGRNTPRRAFALLLDMGFRPGSSTRAARRPPPSSWSTFGSSSATASASG